MNSLFYLKAKNYLSNGLFLLIFLIPLFPSISVKITILLLAIALTIAVIEKSLLVVFGNSIDFILYLTVLIIGLFYSEDFKNGLKVLETNFSFFSLPIIFNCFNKSFTESHLYRMFYSFMLGLLSACLICVIHATILFTQTGDVQSFFSYELTDIINVQPTYLAYYLIASITFGLYLLYYKKNESKELIIIASVLFFFLMLIFTGGQTAFISMLFVFSFFILKFLIEERFKIRYVVVILICVMVALMFLTQALEKNGSDLILSDSWERFVLWKSAIKAIPNIFFGAGTGDDKIVLNEYYLIHGLTQYLSDNYNSHNQFIQILLTNGFPGLVVILFLIGRPLYLSVRNQYVLGVLIFFPFLIYGTTEVFLGRYQGVVFFALLHQVFISYYSSLKPSLTPLKGA